MSGHVIPRRLTLLPVAALAWLFLAAVPALADGGPHVMDVNNGTLGLNADSCAGCHRVHTAQGPLLLKTAVETDLCLSCHGAAVTGATTDVMTGVQYQLSGTPGSPRGGSEMGALRSGGFGQARLDTANAARIGYTSYGGGFLAKVPVGDPADATSAHLDLDGANGVVASRVAWGNGANGSGAGPTVDLTCTSCHNPHGNGQYRILRPIPDPEAVSGTFVPAGSDANVTDSPLINAASGDPDTKNYTVIQVRGTEGNDATYLLYADQVVSGGYDATDGDYFHRWVPWNVANPANRSYDAPNGHPSTFNSQMTAWCSACHTRYFAFDSFVPRPGDEIYKYQHQTVYQGAFCTTCHVSHGSNALMSGGYSATQEFPGGYLKLDPDTSGIVPDSRLLKFDNRGTCQACHDPTGPDGQISYVGPVPSPGVP